MRAFLSPFRLPGEAQKIDRIMCEFSQRYCTQNPAVFADPDAAYVLGFSVSMRNTLTLTLTLPLPLPLPQLPLPLPQPLTPNPYPYP